jgi:tRNA1(Val) A37 N6-methylase TrmN6
MLLQRASDEAVADAIDVDKASVQQAAVNGLQWPGRMRVFHASLQSLIELHRQRSLEAPQSTAETAKARQASSAELATPNPSQPHVLQAEEWCLPSPSGYDLIISNPPFWDSSLVDRPGGQDTDSIQISCQIQALHCLPGVFCLF